MVGKVDYEDAPGKIGLLLLVHKPKVLRKDGRSRYQSLQKGEAKEEARGMTPIAIGFLVGGIRAQYGDPWVVRRPYQGRSRVEHADVDAPLY